MTVETVSRGGLFARRRCGRSVTCAWNMAFWPGRAAALLATAISLCSRSARSIAP